MTTRHKECYQDDVTETVGNKFYNKVWRVALVGKTTLYGERADKRGVIAQFSIVSGVWRYQVQACSAQSCARRVCVCVCACVYVCMYI